MLNITLGTLNSYTYCPLLPDGAGWMNVLGQFALTAFNALLLAKHVAIMWLLGNGHVFPPLETLLVYASEFLFSSSSCSTEFS